MGWNVDVLSAALDSGLAIGQVFIFFVLEFPRNGGIGLSTIQAWWGNTVVGRTADAQQVPLWTVAPNSTFG